MVGIIEKLEKNHDLNDSELKTLIETDVFDEELFSAARRVRESIYGKDVYIRGLIEFTNHCRCNCYYCGIRRDNKNVLRYRLTKDEILSCCEKGYSLGFRTFVLQGGEDEYFTDDKICEIIKEIKINHPDCAVTLSLGEKSRKSYEAYRNAGADRYLLRHESADGEHYSKLHPKSSSIKNRKRCLLDLKELGYQVGSGFMVGSPYQTTQNIISDLRYLKELKPDMIGIGPYITHKETPFADKKSGSITLTLRILAILRLMFPKSLIPATTALGTLDNEGQKKGILSGANVIMPNLSPLSVRKKYEIYENKLSTKEEAAESLFSAKKRIEAIGYKIVTDIGHAKSYVL